MSTDSSEFTFEPAGVSAAGAKARSLALLTEGSDLLSSLGWHKLLVPNEDEFDQAFSSFSAGTITSTNTVFDFYRALFHVPNAFSPASAMFSFLPRLREDGNWSSQRYELFDLNDTWDCSALLSCFNSEHLLVFPGLFRFDYRVNAELSNLYALNAFVVDIDPLFSGTGGAHDKNFVECPLTVSVLEDLLTVIPAPLQPTHICLSGNGVHLWYVLTETVNVGRARNPRRAKWAEFKGRFARFLQVRFANLPVFIDPNDKVLSHGYRPPGSLTKHGLQSCCFQNPRAAKIDIVAFSRSLSLFDAVSGSDAIITQDDIRWLSKEEFLQEREAQKRQRLEELSASPATENQVNYLVYLSSLCGNNEQANTFIAMNMLEAGAAIGAYKETLAKNRIQENKTYRNLPVQAGWGRAPHPLNAGKTGGVYGTIYKNITRVGVGNRYMALVMLAGVAYMMSNPPKPLDEVRKDFLALLDTSWAHLGNPPLTAKEIESALKGYKESNIRSKKGIIDVLGFDPFLPPAKRNGRTRSEHLQVYVPQQRKKKLHDKNVALIAHARQAGATTKAEVARQTGLSYPTVLKYWEESGEGFECVSCEKTSASMVVQEARRINPHATKSEIARLTGLSRPTVIKYWEV